MRKSVLIVGVMAAALLLAVGSARAADLNYNTTSTLTLTGVQTYDNVRVGHGGGSTATIVDATGTTSFTSNGTQFYVGTNSGSGTGVGTINLGILNNITATQLTIGGAQPDNNASTGNAGRVTTLTGGVTTINATNMAVGTGKSNGTIQSLVGGRFILGSNATLNLYGLTGSGSRAALVVGRWDDFNSHTATGGMDLSAGVANLKLSSLDVGRILGSSGGSGNACSGTLTLSGSASNHLDISGVGSVIRVGYNTSSGNATTATGTLTIGNLDSTSSVTSTDNGTAIVVGGKTGSNNGVGTLNLNGGTLKITTTGAAIADGGGTSTLNLSGGTKLIAGSNSSNWIHSLDTATIGSGGATIDTDGKTIGISQAFSGTGGLKKDGLGTLTLNGANSYSGTTTVSNGTLALGAADRISNSSALSVTGGTFDLGGFTETVAAVTMSSGTISNGTLTGSSYALDSGTVSAGLAGAGGLIKDGAGLLTLSTAQGYQGATEIKAGELSLSGSLHANSAVTVKSGATISGTGTINGSLAFEGNANLRADGITPLNVTGNVTFASGFSVANILGFDWAAATLDTPYTLIAGNNVSLANLTQTSALTAGDVGGGRKAYFQTGSLALVVIPEPATLGLIGVVGVAMLRRRRIVKQ